MSRALLRSSASLLSVPLAVLLGCGAQAPAAQAPSAAPSSATTAPAASASADAGSPGALEREAAALDDAMQRARERIRAAGSSATDEMREELARLEKRYAEVKRELSALGSKVDERATTVGHQAKDAAEDLRRDLDRFIGRLKN